jgi:PAS domain-containing protein
MNENPAAESLAITSLIEARTDPFVLIDDHYRIVTANTRCASLYGLRPGQLTGFKCHEVSHHRSTPCHHHGGACPLRAAMDTGEATEVTQVHLGCGDQQQRFRIKGYPLEFRGRRLLGESIEPLKKAETGESAAPASRPAWSAPAAPFCRRWKARARGDRSCVTVDCTTLPEALADPDFEHGPDQPTNAAIEVAAKAAGIEYRYLPVSGG